MAEIRHITTAERPSRGGHYVLIERASGVSNRASDVFYAPEPGDDVQTAIAAADAWADLNGVPVVYVVDSLSAGPNNGGVP